MIAGGMRVQYTGMSENRSTRLGLWLLAMFTFLMVIVFSVRSPWLPLAVFILLIALVTLVKGAIQRGGSRYTAS